MTFSATRRFTGSRCSAAYTIPIPPSPRTESTWDGPICLGCCVTACDARSSTAVSRWTVAASCAGSAVGLDPSLAMTRVADRLHDEAERSTFQLFQLFAQEISALNFAAVFEADQVGLAGRG